MIRNPLCKMAGIDRKDKKCLLRSGNIGLNNVV
jgi:hypothetical protein